MGIRYLRRVVCSKQFKTQILIWIIILEILHLGIQLHGGVKLHMKKLFGLPGKRTNLDTSSVKQKQFADRLSNRLTSTGKPKDTTTRETVHSHKHSILHTDNEKIKTRMLHYKTVCRNRDSVDEDDPMATLGDNFQISRRHRLVYCSVLKAGSTFWRRFLQVIDSGKVKSPYSIEAKDVNEKSETLQNVFIEDLYEMSQRNLLFMFSRNPYKRLLSAYLDKLYSANPLFWHSWGHKIKRKPHTICYHDITFEEFLRYVVKLEKAPLWKRDPHYASMREVCKPCQIQYDFIGKIESFKEDVFFFLDQLNISRYKGVFRDFEEDTFSDSIWDISHTFEDWKRNIRKCMSMHEAFQRTWRRLQIRGQISENMTFPLNEWQSKNLPRHEFFEIVEDAHKRSKNKTDLAKQRENMFQRIYSSVPKDLLNELFHVLRPDFEIFDYEKFSQFQNVSPDEDLFDFKNTKY